MSARWLLPEGIADLLPQEAAALESLRRRLLDLCHGHGFELVEPPLIEYLESLLIGSGGDLDLQTFKLVDQLSGRMLGVRADMTPQVARIDAHLLHDRGVTRLCYCGPVLRTRGNGAGGSRAPIQLGAEIYGHQGIEADIEAVDLLLTCLTAAGLPRGRLDLCDLGLVRLLLAELSGVVEDECFALLEARDLPGLRARLAAQAGADHATGGRDAGSLPVAASELLALVRCHGPAPVVIAKVRPLLGRHPEAMRLVDRLEQIIASPRLARHRDRFELALDLADVRGFRYHSGLSFAVYASGHAQAVGRGGRYDGVGSVFGRSRPATGFSLDLRELSGLCEHPQGVAAILAPWSDDPDLLSAIEALRAGGEPVVQHYPGAPEDDGPGRPRLRRLARIDGRWQVVQGS